MTTLVATKAKALRSQEIPPITAADRCDRCIAQARVIVLIREATAYLNFCLHHFEQHKSVLLPKADMVLDERKFLYDSEK